MNARIRVLYAKTIYPPGLPVTVPPAEDRLGEKMRYFGVLPIDGPFRLLDATFSGVRACVMYDAEQLGTSDVTGKIGGIGRDWTVIMFYAFTPA